MNNSSQPLEALLRRFEITLTKLADEIEIQVDEREEFDNRWNNSAAFKSHFMAEMERRAKRMRSGDTLSFHYSAEPTVAEVFDDMHRAVRSARNAVSRESYSAVGILRIVSHVLPIRMRARYLEEFRGELCELSRPGQVRFALSIAFGIIRLRNSATQVVEQQG